MIEDVLDHSVLLTRTGGFQKFLANGRAALRLRCTWKTEAEIRKLNLVLLEKYHSLFHGVESSQADES